MVKTWCGNTPPMEMTEFIQYSVNVRILQNTLRNFEIAHAQLAHFGPKHDCKPNLRPTDSDPNRDPNETVILILAKSRRAFYKLRRLTNCAQQQRQCNNNA